MNSLFSLFFKENNSAPKWFICAVTFKFEIVVVKIEVKCVYDIINYVNVLINFIFNKHKLCIVEFIIFSQKFEFTFRIEYIFHLFVL
jgi:hypothetical protein